MCNIDVYLSAIASGGKSEGLELFHYDRQRRDSLPAGPNRDHFLAGRRLIRFALGANVLRNVVANPGKKPLIINGPEISLSHCPSHVALAVSPNGEIGIDIEQRDREIDFYEVADLSLTTREKDILYNLRPWDRRIQFLAMWTRKEALLKGMGIGLRLPPNCIDTLPGGFAEKKGFEIRTISHGESDIIMSIAKKSKSEDAMRLKVKRVFGLDR